MFSQNIYYPLSVGREWKYQTYGNQGQLGHVETRTVISYEKKDDTYKIKHVFDYGKKDPAWSLELIKEKDEQIIFLAYAANLSEDHSFMDYIHIDPNFNMSPKSLPQPKVLPEIYTPVNIVLLDTNMRINSKWIIEDTDLRTIINEVIDTLTVTVKAGTFNNVLKIKRTENIKYASDINIYYEYYAPDTGLIKEEISSSHFGFRIFLRSELISYAK